MGMTDRDRKLLGIFLVFVFLGGFYFLVLGKKKQAVVDAQTSLSTAQAALTAAKTAEIQGKAEKKHYPVSYSRVLRMGKAIPVDSDFASLLIQVNDISDDSKVNFLSLTSSPGSAQTGGAGQSSSTTCDAETAGASAATGATGASGATPAPVATPPASVTSATGTTGVTGQSGLGRSVNKARKAKDSTNAEQTAAESSSAELAVKCSSSPTLTDLAAVSAGLNLYTYSFTFSGSFYNLHTVYDGLLDLVKAHNGKVKVTGRLLQINSINMAVKSFPDLTATVGLTGYSLPVGTTIAAGATSEGPAGAATAAATTPGATAATPATPPAAVIGAK